MNYTPVFQHLVDLEDLQLFIKPRRGHENDPLRIVCAQDECSNISIEKFGRPVEFLIERPPATSFPVLEVKKLHMNNNQVRVEFLYDDQGVGGHITMQQDGADWIMSDYEVYEN